MTTTQNIELTGTQLLYGRPEALHSAVHVDLRYRANLTPFEHAATIHLVPLLVGEFAQAMMHYPIIFAGAEKTPLAVMALSQGENLFVKDGQFEAGAYVPAYLRRYPFTLAGTGEDEFVVCVDRDAPGFVAEGDGEALFDDGEPTAFTKHAMGFLQEFEAERKRTEAFVERLTAADVFEVKNTMLIDGAGQQEHIADYFAVAEERLASLQNDVLADFVKTGAMVAMVSHLLSLHRWDGLIARRAAHTLISAAPDNEVADTSTESAYV